MNDLNAFIVGSGVPPDQLKVVAEACLSVGYRRDTMDMAVGSALLMVGLGENIYSEFVGHHLGKGFGVEENVTLASTWYENAITTLQDGATPVFAPEFSGRDELLHWAVFDGGTGAVQSAIPTFGTKSN